MRRLVQTMSIMVVLSGCASSAHQTALDVQQAIRDDRDAREAHLDPRTILRLDRALDEAVASLVSATR